jgi:hypoxanthine phosphoribosyltransferase
MINFKSYYDMSRDIAAGIQHIPPTDIVVSIPKSGIVPATIIASFLNVQVIDIDSFLFAQSRRSGMRKLHSGLARQRVLVVDDSVNTGREMRRVRDRLSVLEADFDFIYCAVYGLDEGKHDTATDIVLHYVPQPRVFQWNYRNHILAENALFDKKRRR